MLRRTKIVATLGPATDQPETLEALLLAGVNVVRLNFSHGEAKDHQQRTAMVRKLAKKHGLYIAILGDLQGPKIRIAKFKDKQVELKTGQNFTLDAKLAKDAGDHTQVGIDYPELAGDCQAGDLLLLDDGRIVLVVNAIENHKIICNVKVGGTLSNNKGLNRQGGGLSAPSLTDKDRRDMAMAAELELDYLALSFPRCADDIVQAREQAQAAGCDARLIAKIERAEAVSDTDTVDAIITAADGVMVARGDLGVEVGDAELIGIQKYIISRARALGRCVITATQMMESMIYSPLPTRAEVFDVANAVLDGTDAVMLSAETANGHFPVQTIEAVVRVIMGAERHTLSTTEQRWKEHPQQEVDESIAIATMYTANHLGRVKAIICMTESGETPLMMSRISSGIPIFALSPSSKTLKRVALFRGVNALLFSGKTLSADMIEGSAVKALIEHSRGVTNDLVIITKGDRMNEHGGTNALKIIKASEL